MSRSDNDRTPVAALLFDVFGTCVDWRHGVADFVSRELGRAGLSVDAVAFADAWRAQYVPAMARVRSGQRGYVPLDVLHRENLDATLEAFGLGAALDDAARWRLNGAWEQLPAWPDVPAGLQLMKQQALIAPCSNGSIALMARLSKFAGLPWDAVLGAEIAQTYKPEPEVYLACTKSLRLPPEQVMMVAAHNSDLLAAAEAGLQTAFVPRLTEHGPGQTTDLQAHHRIDTLARDFNQLASSLAPADRDAG